MQIKSALMASSLEDAVQLARARTLQSGLLSRLGMIGLGLGGLGAAARGAQSLYGLYRRNVKPQRKPVPAPVSVQIPYPADEEEAKTAGSAGEAVGGGALGALGGLGLGTGIGALVGMLRNRKLPMQYVMKARGLARNAGQPGVTGSLAGINLAGPRRAGLKSLMREGKDLAGLRASSDAGLGGLLGTYGGAIGGATYGATKQSGLLGPGSFMRGDQAVSESGIPWMLPASLAVGMGGLYGGWKAADKLLDARRKSELKGELDKAKSEYEAALLSEYQPKMGSAESTLASELDRMYAEYSKLEKKAGVVDHLTDPLTYTDLGGKLTGGYLAMSGLASAATAAAVYNLVKKRQESQLLRKAQKNRERKLFESQPSPLYAEPIPVAR